VNLINTQIESDCNRDAVSVYSPELQAPLPTGRRWPRTLSSPSRLPHFWLSSHARCHTRPLDFAPTYSIHPHTPIHVFLHPPPNTSQLAFTNPLSSAHSTPNSRHLYKKNLGAQHNMVVQVELFTISLSISNLPARRFLVVLGASGLIIPTPPQSLIGLQSSAPTFPFL